MHVSELVNTVGRLAVGAVEGIDGHEVRVEHQHAGIPLFARVSTPVLGAVVLVWQCDVCVNKGAGTLSRRLHQLRTWNISTARALAATEPAQSASAARHMITVEDFIVASSTSQLDGQVVGWADLASSVSQQATNVHQIIKMLACVANLACKTGTRTHQLMYSFARPLSRLSRLVARRLPIVCVSASKRCPAVVRAFTFCSLDAMSKVEEEVAAAPAAPTTSADAPNHASWQQTMLRVKDPEVEVPFWQYVSVVSTDRCALSCGTVVLMTSRKMFGAQDQLWLRACGPP